MVYWFTDILVLLVAVFPKVAAFCLLNILIFQTQLFGKEANIIVDVQNRSCATDMACNCTSVPTWPVGDVYRFIFDETALTKERIESMKHLLKTAVPANTECVGFSNKIRMVNHLVAHNICIYGKDHRGIYEHLSQDFQDLPYLICDGDCSISPDNAVVAAKSRAISNHPTTTLLPLDKCDRHFGPVIEAYHDGYHFYEKQPVAFWRGATTNVCWDRGRSIRE